MATTSCLEDSELMRDQQQQEAVLDLLLKSAVRASERTTDLECRLCVANMAIHILVNSHPDKEALKTHFTSAYVAMQQSEASHQNPERAFAFEQLLERLFGTID